MQYRGSIRIQRLCIIKGNQKGDPGRDRIASTDRAIANQRDLILIIFLCVDNCRTQIVESLISRLKHSYVIRNKFCRDRAVFFHFQWRGSGRCDILAGGNIIPAHELIPIIGRCRKLICGHGALGAGGFFCNCRSVYGITSVFSRQEGRSGRHIGNQRNICHCDLGRCSTAGLQIDLNRASGGQFLGIGTTFSEFGTAIHLNGTSVDLHGVVKGQHCRSAPVILDNQCRILVFRRENALGTYCRASDCRFIGCPCILCRAGIGQANIRVAQAGQVSACRCKGGQRKRWREGK